MKDYVIYNEWIAQKFINMGFKLKNIAPNRKNPKFNIYFFEDTQKLRDALEIEKRVIKEKFPQKCDKEK